MKNIKNIISDLLLEAENRVEAELNDGFNQKSKVWFMHKGRKPKNLSKEQLLVRFAEMHDKVLKIFKNPWDWFEKGWNGIDIGILLLGSEQLDKQLFPPHPSGKTLLDRTNPMVLRCVDAAEEFLQEENLVLIDGLPFEREVSE